MIADGETLRGGQQVQSGNGGTEGITDAEPNKSTSRTVTMDSKNDGWTAGNGGGLGTIAY